MPDSVRLIVNTKEYLSKSQIVIFLSEEATATSLI